MCRNARAVLLGYCGGQNAPRALKKREANKDEKITRDTPLLYWEVAARRCVEWSYVISVK